MTDFKSLFQLDPEVAYFNHGGFGATPLPVFEVYQDWQRRLERQPTAFFGRAYYSYMETAREALGAYLNAPPSDVVFVENATIGVNIVSRSLKLQPGDEILTTNQEYGACTLSWEFACQTSGARVVYQPLPIPVQSPDELVEALWEGVTPRTRVIYISHITSSTALILPVAKICQRAREQGIITVVDGAHAPGQIVLDMQALGADFYTGNLHKWLCAPKGAAFLYTRPEMQKQLLPLVVSWGYGPDYVSPTGSSYLDWHQWWGTKDPSSYLTVPAAIDFQAKYHWPEVRERSRRMLTELTQRLCSFTGLQPHYPDGQGLYQQMATIPLPKLAAPAEKHDEMLARFKVELPIHEWNGRTMTRVSIQAYTSQEDVERLVAGLLSIL